VRQLKILRCGECNVQYSTVTVNIIFKNFTTFLPGRRREK